ncbi:hypothetical protein [Desulfobacca acetoxidans]|uniref:Uncharacterized protein n=1 Tax=Desulfobacca acetoxidans (strain ATCC 700848 / DSM 11109 / ASRB2) TaxID=880072 RepID=F2NEH7_DESAR|nr:hypothetical protein [Desulfobacca acetoxidans]AEB08167.1 hypothetical protein Desac_0275 [Desulfobacca acetoxidans DSM 11109]HAY22707.1 hypothetical protein [Desulfobacterales bacterium]
MSGPKMPLRSLQNRLIWFFLFIMLIGLGAGYYFSSPLYTMVGLLGMGVVIGGLLRLVLDYRQLSKRR